MKKLVFAASLVTMVATAGAASAQLAFIQIAPTTSDSTIVCANWAMAPDGTWQALNGTPYSLGIIHGIIPPARPFKTGSFIYNNVDLASQLNAQCGAGVVVRARY